MSSKCFSASNWYYGTVEYKDFRETTVPGTGHMAQLQFTQRATDHEILMKGQRTEQCKVNTLKNEA